MKEEVILVDSNDKEIGVFGEVSPTVLRNWHIKMPTVALEIEIKEL